MDLWKKTFSWVVSNVDILYIWTHLIEIVLWHLCNSATFYLEVKTYIYAVTAVDRKQIEYQAQNRKKKKTDLVFLSILVCPGPPLFFTYSLPSFSLSAVVKFFWFQSFWVSSCCKTLNQKITCQRWMKIGAKIFFWNSSN